MRRDEAGFMGFFRELRCGAAGAVAPRRDCRRSRPDGSAIEPGEASHNGGWTTRWQDCDDFADSLERGGMRMVVQPGPGYRCRLELPHP